MLIQTDNKSTLSEANDAKEGKQTRLESTLIQLLRGDANVSETTDESDGVLSDEIKILAPKLQASMTPEALKEVVAAAKTYLSYNFV